MDTTDRELETGLGGPRLGLGLTARFGRLSTVENEVSECCVSTRRTLFPCQTVRRQYRVYIGVNAHTMSRDGGVE